MGGKTLAAEPDLNFGVGAQVLDPVRCFVLGDDEEAAVVLREPDLDFTRTTTVASAGGEIEVLFLVDLTDL